MEKLNIFLERIFKFLASLKLAVIVILGIAIISAVGTIVEAKYDATVAQKLVYHSPYMYFVLAMLCVNLFNVMVDRWPWKRRHTGFILAHIGIIVLIGGSAVTKYFGIDGSMSFDIGNKNRFVTIGDSELGIYSSFGEGNYAKLYGSPVDFLVRPPEKYEYKIQLGEKLLRLTDYYHYSLRKTQMVKSEDKSSGPAVRFQLMSSRVNMSQWILRDRKRPYDEYTLGPATVVLQESNAFKYESGNVIVLSPVSDEEISYQIFTESKKGKVTKGILKIGDVVKTGWMDIELRLLNYFEHGYEKVEYEKKDSPAETYFPALAFEFEGKKYWVGHNSVARLFSDNSMFLVSFGNVRLDIGFDMTLTKFNIGKYQGTNRAASYSSEVDVPGLGHREISMNNPLKHNGFTFYQASFQADEQGEPVASILSVNRDPGRWIKYLGSFLIVLGSIILFYFRKYKL